MLDTFKSVFLPKFKFSMTLLSGKVSSSKIEYLLTNILKVFIVTGKGGVGPLPVVPNVLSKSNISSLSNGAKLNSFPVAGLAGVFAINAVDEFFNLNSVISFGIFDLSSAKSKFIWIDEPVTGWLKLIFLKLGNCFFISGNVVKEFEDKLHIIPLAFVNLRPAGKFSNSWPVIVRLVTLSGFV